jgi:hypothetical protein
LSLLPLPLEVLVTHDRAAKSVNLICTVPFTFIVVEIYDLQVKMTTHLFGKTIRLHEGKKVW